MKFFALAASVAISAATLMAGTASERLNESAQILGEIMRTPEKGIPEDLLAKARCVVIVPNMKKAAFVVGGEYGRGFAECRRAGGGWSAPAAIRMEGGSVGFQIGGSSTDVVMLVMNEKGMNRLLEDKFTLGADASIAAGPVGRTAKAGTDVKLDAEILSYSRSKGLFAGVSLSGVTLRPDKDENMELYGKATTNREALMGEMKAPAGADALAIALSKYSMHREADADRSKQ